MDNNSANNQTPIQVVPQTVPPAPAQDVQSAPASQSVSSRSRFPYIDAISFGFDSTKKNIKFLLLLILTVVIINVLIDTITKATAKVEVIGIIFGIVSVIVSIIVQMGITAVSITLADGKTPIIKDLFMQYKKIIFYVLTEALKFILQLIAAIPLIIAILIMLFITLFSIFAIVTKHQSFNPFLIAVGIIVFILLVLPSIIVSLRLQFASYFVIDKNYNPIQAIKASWSITKGYPLQLFLFGLLLGLVVLAGLLALIVGLLITIPTALIAQAYIYRKLSSQTPGI